MLEIIVTINVRGATTEIEVRESGLVADGPAAAAIDYIAKDKAKAADAAR